MSDYTFDDLLYLMLRLRDAESGCPWDCEQNYKTLTKYTLEEVYEVIDAIERDDMAHLPEELGDLLFQVVFYAQLGKENGVFSFDDIVNRLIRKLISRHPHVFPDGSLESRRSDGEIPAHQAIASTWESKKQSEREAKGHTRLLADVPVALPALTRAQKIQKRAGKVGFDWPNIEDVLKKVEEELGEFSSELNTGNQQALEEELGDLLFSVVNLARFVGCDAEQSLRNAVRKFENRFSYMEDVADSNGKSLENMDLADLESLWQQAKSSSH